MCSYTEQIDKKRLSQLSYNSTFCFFLCLQCDVSVFVLYAIYFDIHMHSYAKKIFDRPTRLTRKKETLGDRYIER